MSEEYKFSYREAMKDKSCGQSVSVLFFALFLLMLVILGNAIKTGSQNSAWGLYVFVILIGIGMMIVLITGTGSSKEGGTPWLFSGLSILMSGLAILALIMAELNMESKDVAIAYIAVILPGLCGLVYSPIYSILKKKYTSFIKKNAAGSDT